MPACHAGDRRFESGRVRHPFLASSYAPSARPDGAFLYPSTIRAVRARDPRYDPRPPHPRSGAHPVNPTGAAGGGGGSGAGRPRTPGGVTPPVIAAAFAVVLLVLVVAIGFGGGIIGGPSGASPTA